MHSISACIDVPDLDEGIAFYTNGLGFQKLKEMGENAFILDAGKIKVYLVKKDPGTVSTEQPNTERNYDRHWTPVHLDFNVVDIEKTISEIISAGGKHEGGQSGDWGRMAYCSDPFGNGFCLIQENK